MFMKGHNNKKLHKNINMTKMVNNNRGTYVHMMNKILLIFFFFRFNFNLVLDMDLAMMFLILMIFCQLHINHHPFGTWVTQVEQIGVIFYRLYKD
jgi:hypothetical protein